ncbi:hypothetical protein CR513_22667, partial [Mucuna pruriens]
MWKGDFDVNINVEVPHTFVTGSQITSPIPIHQHTQVGDVPSSWHVGDELMSIYVLIANVMYGEWRPINPNFLNTRANK